MIKWVSQLAEDLGAQIVAELPKGEAPPTGAAHAAAFYSRRMEELRRQDTAKNFPATRRTVPVDESTYLALQTAAEMLWPDQKMDAAKFGENLVKGMAVLILNHLIKRLDEKKKNLQGTMNAKDVIQAAMIEMLGEPIQAAG